MGVALGILGIVAILVGIPATANDGITGLRITTRKQGTVILVAGLVLVAAAAALYLFRPAHS